jgi:hypothetical protein
MTVFVRPPDVIDRGPVPVMGATCADDVDEIQRLWTRFEELVGLHSRKMYGLVDVAGPTYTTCTPIRHDDDPGALGLIVGQLPGGSFLRGHLHGDPPGVYAFISPGFEELEAARETDRDRSLVEYYKRRDHIELWLPVPVAVSGDAWRREVPRS